jgi:hypothetical protein
MSEQLVARYQAKQQLPVAIVRPSLVSAIAGEQRVTPFAQSTRLSLEDCAACKSKLANVLYMSYPADNASYSPAWCQP